MAAAQSARLPNRRRLCKQFHFLAFQCSSQVKFWELQSLVLGRCPHHHFTPASAWPAKLGSMKAIPTLLTAAALAASGMTVAQAQTQPAQSTPSAQSNVGAGLPISIQKDDRFLLLSGAGLARAFPNAATRPDVVFVTQDRKVTISLEYRTTSLRAGEITTLLTQYPTVLRRQLPTISTLNTDIVRAGGNQWAQFVMTLPTQNGERRLEQLITSVNNRPMVVTIAGMTDGYKANETAVRNLINSIQVIR